MRMDNGIEALILNLNSDDSKIRREAVLALGYDGAKSVAPLIQAVRDDVVTVDAVSEVFKQIGEASIEPLTDMLHSDNNEYQRKAAHILSAVGDSRALVQLIITLDDDDDRVRAEVASALGKFRDMRAIGPLLKAMQDSSAQVRANAAFSLGNFNDEKITDMLLMALEDSESVVRRSVIRALANKPDEKLINALTTATRDSDESVRQMAAAALRHRKGDSVAFERLNIEHDISDDTKSTIEKIMSDGVLDTQDMEILRHSNPRVRSQLLEYIAQQSGPKMVPLMLPALNDINPAVRAKAISSIAKLKNKAVAPLLELLPQQTSPYMRAGIAEVLGEIGDKEAQTALIGLLSDKDSMVVMNAITALTHIQSLDNISAPLTSLLNSKDEAIRTHAAAAMNKLGYEIPKHHKKGVGNIFRRIFGGDK